MTRPPLDGVCIDVGVRAGSKAWLAARRTGIGASEIGMALGIAPHTWGGPYVLWSRKVGLLGEQPDRAEMEWGRLLEGVILKRFLKCHPEFRSGPCLRGHLYRHNEREWELGTPDAVVFDRRPRFAQDSYPRTKDGVPVVVEVKTGHSHEGWGPEGSDEVPVYYRAQILQNMDIVGATVGWMPVLFKGREYREYRIVRDESDLRIMHARGKEFWRRVVERDAPPVDAGAATHQALKGTRLDPGAQAQVDADLIRKYLRAKALEKRAERFRVGVENQVRLALGTASVGMAGASKVATRSEWSQDQFQLADFRADHPELADKYTTQVRRSRLTVTGKEI